MNPAPTSCDALLAVYAQAVHDRDVDALMRLYDPDVRVFDSWATWSYEGRDAWRPMIANWFSSIDNDHVEVGFSESKLLGDGPLRVLTVFVRYMDVAPDGRCPRFMDNRLTWAVQADPSGWRIVHEHTSAPIDLTDAKALLNRP